MSQISSLFGQHFAYASGRTGVLQQVLLSSSDKDRLLGASDLETAEQILTELKMTDAIDQGLRKTDDVLQALTSWIKAEVDMMSPESKRPTFHILWIEEFAPLLAYLLKKHFSLTSAISKEPQSKVTENDRDDLAALIEDDTEGTLPSALISFVREMKEKQEPTPQEIDNAVAQYVATMQLRLARASGSKMIRQFVIHKIDLINIRTAVRLRDTEADPSVFLTGGTLDVKRLCGSLDGIVKAIERSGLPFSLGEAVRKSADNPNALEIALSEVTASDIAHMWNIPLSIEPVFAFAALAQSQLALLRALMIGKRAGLDPQAIKKMLPPYIPASHYVL